MKAEEIEGSDLRFQQLIIDDWSFQTAYLPLNETGFTGNSLTDNTATSIPLTLTISASGMIPGWVFSFISFFHFCSVSIPIVKPFTGLPLSFMPI